MFVQLMKEFRNYEFLLCARHYSRFLTCHHERVFLMELKQQWGTDDRHLNKQLHVITSDVEGYGCGGSHRGHVREMAEGSCSGADTGMLRSQSWEDVVEELSK